MNAIGALVEVKTGQGVQRREITSGGGHVSGTASWIHVGLGTADKAQVRVRWPGEGWGEAFPVEANQFLIMDKSAGAPRPWQPPR